jgi:hypothetical protein
VLRDILSGLEVVLDTNNAGETQTFAVSIQDFESRA